MLANLEASSERSRDASGNGCPVLSGSSAEPPAQSRNLVLGFFALHQALLVKEHLYAPMSQDGSPGCDTSAHRAREVGLA